LCTFSAPRPSPDKGGQVRLSEVDLYLPNEALPNTGSASAYLESTCYLSRNMQPKYLVYTKTKLA